MGVSRGGAAAGESSTFKKKVVKLQYFSKI